MSVMCIEINNNPSIDFLSDEDIQLRIKYMSHLYLLEYNWTLNTSLIVSKFNKFNIFVTLFNKTKQKPKKSIKI